jgi:hypothetical protein
LAQAIFKRNFPRKNTPTFLKPVILHLSAYKDGTECSETSAFKIQTLGNYPEENIQHLEHGESLKSKTDMFQLSVFVFVWSVDREKVFW